MMLDPNAVTEWSTAHKIFIKKDVFWFGECFVKIDFIKTNYYKYLGKYII